MSFRIQNDIVFLFNFGNEFFSLIFRQTNVDYETNKIIKLIKII